jgi:hypothetical protein
MENKTAIQERSNTRLRQAHELELRLKDALEYANEKLENMEGGKKT